MYFSTVNRVHSPKKKGFFLWPLIGCTTCSFSAKWNLILDSIILSRIYEMKLGAILCKPQEFPKVRVQPLLCSIRPVMNNKCVSSKHKLRN